MRGSQAARVGYGIVAVCRQCEKLPQPKYKIWYQNGVCRMKISIYCGFSLTRTLSCGILTVREMNEVDSQTGGTHRSI